MAAHFRELDIDTEGAPGTQMSVVGQEIGTVTKRKRRCGWFDAAALRRSAMINGLTGLCITKLDVMDGIEEINICTGYVLNGEKLTYCLLVRMMSKVVYLYTKRYPVGRKVLLVLRHGMAYLKMLNIT